MFNKVFLEMEPCYKYKKRDTQKMFFNLSILLNFHDRGRHHIEISKLFYRANQWICFYMIGASVMKELKLGSTGRLIAFISMGMIIKALVLS